MRLLNLTSMNQISSLQTGISERSSKLRLNFLLPYLKGVLKLMTQICKNVPKTFCTLFTSWWTIDITTSVFASQLFHCLPNQRSVHPLIGMNWSIDVKLTNPFLPNISFLDPKSFRMFSEGSKSKNRLNMGQ